MYPTSLITAGVSAFAIFGVIVSLLAGCVLIELLEREEYLTALIFSAILGVIGALSIAKAINMMDSTYQSLIAEPDNAYYYIGAEYFTTKPSATEGTYEHYFVDERGELWYFETDFPSYDDDSMYLLCMDNMGTPGDIYDDEIMVVWSTK